MTIYEVLMNKRTVWGFGILAVMALLLAACGGQNAGPSGDAPGAQPEEPAGLAIVIGDIGDDPAEIIEGVQPLADYLASQLGEYGITEGQVRVASTSDEMIRLLNSGEIDIYFDSVYPATLISDATGGQVFLRRWRFGVEKYFGVIFTTKDSGITSLEDLPGHTIAFDQPYSTSGFFLPSVTLLDAGILPVPSLTDIGPDEVGYVFSYDDENTLQWVLSGRVDAGATDDYMFNVAFPEEVRGDLVMLAQTESVPRQVAVARPGIAPELLDAIKQVLIHANESEAGLSALDPFQTTQFDEFPEGIEVAKETMRAMMDQVASIELP